MFLRFIFKSKSKEIFRKGKVYNGNVPNTSINNLICIVRLYGAERMRSLLSLFACFVPL